MKYGIARMSRQTLVIAGVLAFSCRFAIPPGYMPASLEDGGPIVFCPSVMPFGFGSDSGHHHEDGHGSKGDQIAWEHCPLGALFDTATVSADLDFHLPVFQQAQPLVLEESQPVSVTPPAFRARAPPVLSTLV
jgi:hypothetical protein